MFAMLQGPWPRITNDGVRIADLEAGVAAGRVSARVLADAIERLVGEAVAAQVEAGMGIVTDGGVRWADPARALLDAIRDRDTGVGGMLVRAWRAVADVPVAALPDAALPDTHLADADLASADLAGAPVAQAILGPWTLALADAGGPGGGGAAGDLGGPAGDLADVLAAEVEALAAAGCPVIQVVEPAVAAVGTDAARRAAFLRAHERLLRRAGNVHAMLVVAGGSAADAGAEAVFGAPYRSHLFDLLAGPDNWYLVRAAPPERGIVCAALAAGEGAEDRDQSPQLVWAARYAASAGARGLDRVGIANASALDGLPPAAARSALAALGRAAGYAAMPVADALDAGLDPRSVVTRPAAGPWPGAPVTPGRDVPS